MEDEVASRSERSWGSLPHAPLLVLVFAIVRFQSVSVFLVWVSYGVREREREEKGREEKIILYYTRIKI